MSGENHNASKTLEHDAVKPRGVLDECWGARLKHPSLRTDFVIVAWVLFALYTLTMPFLSNWANNTWHSYAAYDGRSGMCITPASEFKCTDGQNFTELALKYRGVALGCGCGEGILGEGLCALDPQGYTLSTFISTAPATGAMAGISFVPILATWWYIDVVNIHFQPSPMVAAASWWTMAGFQISYGWFLIATDCTMPVAHGTTTNMWIAFFAVHCLIVGYICHFEDPVGRITISVFAFSLIATMLGFLTKVFPAMVLGRGAYIFWLGEAVGLTSMFGVTPLLLLFGYVDPGGAVAKRGLTQCSLGDERQKPPVHIAAEVVRSAELQQEVERLKAELNAAVSQGGETAKCGGTAKVANGPETRMAHQSAPETAEMEEP